VEITETVMQTNLFHNTELPNIQLKRDIVQSWYSGAFKSEMMWQALRSNSAHLTITEYRVEK